MMMMMVMRHFCALDGSTRQNSIHATEPSVKNAINILCKFSDRKHFTPSGASSSSSSPLRAAHPSWHPPSRTQTRRVEISINNIWHGNKMQLPVSGSKNWLPFFHRTLSALIKDNLRDSALLTAI